MVLNNEALFKEFNRLFVEQFVLQQMANNFAMYYWSSEANAEVDFVTEINGMVVPIEVKGKINVKAKSLKDFRENYHPKLSIRFSLKPIEKNNGLLSLPIYFAGMVGKFI